MSASGELAFARLYAQTRPVANEDGDRKDALLKYWPSFLIFPSSQAIILREDGGLLLSTVDL